MVFGVISCMTIGGKCIDIIRGLIQMFYDEYEVHVENCICTGGRLGWQSAKTKQTKLFHSKE